MRDLCPVTGKRKFRGRAGARVAMENSSRRFVIYLCEHCRHFHVSKGIDALVKFNP